MFSFLFDVDDHESSSNLIEISRACNWNNNDDAAVGAVGATVGIEIENESIGLFDYFPLSFAPQPQPLCMICSHIGNVPTNHDLLECNMCTYCKKWAKEDVHEHMKHCYANSSKTKKPRKVVELCVYWKRGFCKFDTMCRFRHNDSQLAPSACEENGNVTCLECGGKHHIATCTVPCKKCGSYDHRTNRCVECFTCGKWGHSKLSCSICSECRDNHFTKDCPHMFKK